MTSFDLIYFVWIVWSGLTNVLLHYLQPQRHPQSVLPVPIADHHRRVLLLPEHDAGRFGRAQHARQGELGSVRQTAHVRLSRMGIDYVLRLLDAR